MVKVGEKGALRSINVQRSGAGRLSMLIKRWHDWKLLEFELMLLLLLFYKGWCTSNAVHRRIQQQL